MIFGFPHINFSDIQKSLSAGEVITFLSPIELFPAITTDDYSFLDQLEKDRASCFSNVENRETFVLGRLLLRSLLQGLLNTDDIQLRYGAHGKPYCSDPSAPFFNLSHGGGWLGLCICDGVEVGLDLENPDRQLPYVKLAERYFSDNECDQVQMKGKEGFMNIWVKKEACVKALGKGITVPLSEVNTDADTWSFYEIPPTPGLVGMVAHQNLSRKHRFISALI